MTGNRYSIRFVLPIAALFSLLVAVVAQAGQPVTRHSHLVEVLTVTELPVTGEATITGRAVHRETEFHLYELDGIQRIEAKLSDGLTADPGQSKQVVLQRLQELREDDRTRMKRAAMGLAKAMQYGVDRYPAIVFDGQAVVYGITDVQTAIAHYRTWRREGKR